MWLWETHLPVQTRFRNDNNSNNNNIISSSSSISSTYIAQITCAYDQMRVIYKSILTNEKL